MMQQYVEIKEKNPNTILFFRLGDFYEMFFDDALTASRELEIVLTKRDCGGGEKCPMCGIPHHVADVYISKLVSKGYKVAICEQLEDPKKAKKLVKRDIVQVVTPGTIIDSASLDSSDNNYLMSVSIDKNIIGISYVDINAGLIKFTEINYKNNEEALKIIENEIAKIAPSEIIFNDNFFNEANIKPKLETSFGLVLTEVEKYDFNKYVEIINKKLEIDILKEYKNKTGAILSLGS
ncbi:MAG: DNA mismatch repair protein MutS, partial [Tissierellia bacterium]|nr:DNA mismatch repair protein MutS [Tissierellia bacterium]